MRSHDRFTRMRAISIPTSVRWGSSFLRSGPRERSRGASKCDSGGLAGGIGCFAHIPVSERDAALKSLSSPQAFGASEWAARFLQEIAASHTDGIIGYVNGSEPNTAAWNDARKQCIDSARSLGEPLDRRLWTWELRMHTPPEPEEIEALVVSYLGYRRILDIFTHQGIAVPDHVRVIPGEDDADEPGNWFFLPAARMALAGE
jgi:hypothetical protein